MIRVVDVREPDPAGDSPFPGFAFKPFERGESTTSLGQWLDVLENRAPLSSPSPISPRPRADQGRSGSSFRDVHDPSQQAPSAEPTKSWVHRIRDVMLDAPASARLRSVLKDLETRTEADPFGLSPGMVDGVSLLACALHRFYFRVRSEGHDRIPTSGPVVLAANHGGLLPFDGAMAITDVLLRQEKPRLLRAILDRWVADLPLVREFMAGTGQVIGTHENFAALLGRGEAVLVFPEGVDGIRKTIGQRYRLQPFHSGFVGKAIEARAPIVPVAIIGSDDQAPILYDLKILARLLGLPVFPITPTFPWLGPLGLLPYPVSYRIVYGEPFWFHENLAADSIQDRSAWVAMASQVRAAIQGLIDGQRGTNQVASGDGASAR